MKNEGYITIQGWMRNELGLSGNELLAYALIYGFNQDGESTFRGSLGYVAEWLGCSKQTAISTLKKLVEKGLIERIEEPINGILFVRYRILKGGQNSLPGGSKNITTPSQNFLPNNTKTDNKDDKKEKGKRITYEDVHKKQEENDMIDNLIYRHTENAKLRETLHTFLEYRNKKRSPMTELAVRMMLKKLAPFTEEEQIDALETSIVSNWEGVFPKHKDCVQNQQKGVGKVAHEADVYLNDFNEDGSFKW